MAPDKAGNRSPPPDHNDQQVRSRRQQDQGRARRETASSSPEPNVQLLGDVQTVPTELTGPRPAGRDPALAARILPLEAIMIKLDAAAQKYGFQIHRFVFVATMVLLLVINLAIGPPYWFLWALFGWGVGLLAHWWFVLGPGANGASRV